MDPKRAAVQVRRETTAWKGRWHTIKGANDNSSSGNISGRKELKGMNKNKGCPNQAGRSTRTKGAGGRKPLYTVKGCARYIVSMHSGEYPNNGPGIVLVPVAGDHGKQSWLAYNGTPCANGNTHT